MRNVIEKIINGLFGSRQEISKNKKELYGLDNLEDDAIGYPVEPIGIPVVQPHILLERTRGGVDAIRQELGVSSAVFLEYIYPAFENFIRYADFLPASEYKHHSTGGGLVAHSLEVAHRAMRAAQMTHFPVTTGCLTETQQSNVQWRVGTVLAALFHDGGKILADITVHDGSPNEKERVTWDAQSGSTIHDWAAENNIERYFVSWNRDRHMKHQNASLVVMERYIPAKTWSWLEKCYDGKQIHAMMLASVGKTNLSHPMPMIIAEADSHSTKMDMLTRRSHITKELKRVSISEVLCDLIRHYIMTKKWKINEKGAYVWYVNEQLYVCWRNAAPELIEEMIEGGYTMPSVPDVLARLLIEEGQSLAAADGDLYCSIYPEILGDKKNPVKIVALKMRNVQRLVLDPDKLFSLKEHQNQSLVKVEPIKDEVEAVAVAETKPNEKIIEEIFEEDKGSSEKDAKPKELKIRRQKTHESSQETMVRILSNIKESMVRANASAQQKDEPAEVGSKTTTHIENVEVESTRNVESLNDQERKESVKIESVKQEQPVQIEQPDQTTFSDPVSFNSSIAKFIMKHFDFPIKDGKVVISYMEMADILSKAENEREDITMLGIMSSPEVLIHE